MCMFVVVGISCRCLFVVVVLLCIVLVISVLWLVSENMWFIGMWNSLLCSLVWCMLVLFDVYVCSWVCNVLMLVLLGVVLL